MLFNSLTYVFFFAAVVWVYFLLPHRHRWFFLLIASYYFYMSWNPKYAILIMTSTLVDYFCGLQIARSSSRRRRKALLLVSLGGNLGLLFTFKYANFALDSARWIAESAGLPAQLPRLDFLLPVGISFYTFQTLSYTIDLYRGRIEPERHLGRFALFVSFFPQLVAGPIERARDLLPQLRERQEFDVNRVFEGLQLIAWGLFKKVVIADRLALYVDLVYRNPELYDGPSLILATYLFSFQLYCDFSGYSDIAIGSAKVLGIRLTQNFRLPFLSKTMPEFWQRWHITLITWFRDYVFLPLALRRRTRGWSYFCMLVVMLMSGLWHGADWHFVLWGATQGVLLAASAATLSMRDKVYAALGVPAALVGFIRTLITFHLFTFSLVLFRAQSVQEAVYILTHLFQGWPDLQASGVGLLYGIPGVALLIAVQLIQSRAPIQPALARRPLALRWSVYLALLFWIVLFGVDGGSQFIYFQF